ncbi:FtsX-like permease family protein [Galactobacter sp.]|uniref:FtsX-like permease family protein n=1 Tax=Galactobacter sp. TaxID=2676125 RepID=UPI0025BCA4B4|nr:FtsX-like permease family protein [Galactobacter sp.]
MTPIRISWLLRRSTDRRAASLGSGAYALVTTLVALTMAGAHSFLRWDDDVGAGLQGLAALALVLLVVPLVYLGAAAARLSARAQDRRLSTLRLVGATGQQVAGVTVLGAAAEAALGAVAGLVAGAALAPAVGLIHFRGEAIGTAIWMPWWLAALVMVAVVIVAAVSALVGMRRVLVTPLGVRTRAARPVPGWLRLVIAAGLVVLGMMVTSSTSTLGQVVGVAGVVIAILGVFLGGFVALNAVGPWVLGVWARRKLRSASNAASLLSARSVLDDAAATWRQVSGAAMAGFVAVVGGAGAALSKGLDSEPSTDVVSGVDVRTGVIVTLVIAFVGVASTTLVSQAATVLDREDLDHSLWMMGVPPEIPGKARVQGLMGPLVLTLLVAVVASATLLFPLVGMSLITDPVTLLVVALVCVLGVLTVRVAAVVAGRVATR